MKKLIIIAVIALFTLHVSAKEKPNHPNESLRNEIVNLLGDNLSYVLDKNDVTVEVLFTVNNQGELIIVSTNATNEKVEKFIKKKLNYKKVNFKAAKTGEIFLLPLTIKNS